MKTIDHDFDSAGHNLPDIFHRIASNLERIYEEKAVKKF
jgi:hypothetical protein